MPITKRLRPWRPGALLVLALAGFVACSENPTGNDQPSPTTVSVSVASLSFSAVDDTARVSATVLDQNGDPLSGASVSWSSSDQGVATVSGSGLVTATGNGTATLTAASGDARGTVGVDVEQVAVGLRFAPDPVTLPELGDTATVIATVVDANDNPMPTGAVTWMSDAPDTVSVSPLGLVTAEAQGSTRLSAEVDGVTGELAAFVGNAVVVIGSVGPSPMVDGDTAIIRGLGFDPDPAANAVTLDGFDATVTSASSVELRIVVPDADCSPARQGWVRVAARGMADSITAPVHPASLSTLAAGEGVYAADGCVHLAAADGAAEYVVGILSASETPSSLTPAALAARVGSQSVTLATAPSGVARSGSAGTSLKAFSSPFHGATSAAPATTGTRVSASGAALRSPDDGPAWLDRSGEARVRAAERAWLESLGPITPGARRSPARAPAAAPPNEGDTLDINIPDFENPGGACEAGSGTPVEAIVRYVGESVAFLEDVDNPSGGFTTLEYAAFDDFLTDTTMAVITDYFGDFADVDDNQRVLVLLTQEVNKRENLAGFVFSGDLAPLAGFSCAAGNDAEIFYGLAPDPNNSARPITKAQLELIYPPLIAHELTHVLQFTQAFTTSAVIQSSWQFEGGATLAEQLVGYEVFGHGPRQNLGPAEWDAGADTSDDTPDWYRDWVVDMAFYFGFQGEDPPLTTAPEECSWIGREEEGNAGPCENPQRAVYGVPSTLLRWVLDLAGADAADDARLMRQMTLSSTSGIATLEEATGADRLDLLVPFAVTLWADGEPALPSGERDWLQSWDIHGIYDSLNPDASLRPYTSSAAAPDLEVAVRAASSAYLEWTAPSDHAPTSLRIRAPADGGLLPEHMILWVLRVQ